MLEALRRPFVKIVSGLPEDLHKGLPVCLPSRVWTWATKDYLLISSGGGESVLFLAVLLAETNAAFIACMHIRSLLAGPCPVLFTCRLAQAKRPEGGRLQSPLLLSN